MAPRDEHDQSMTLPSSPPLLPASPILPPLPSRSTRHDHETASNSSDTPFFSSDDLADASQTKYESPRRKRHYKRTWWEAEQPGASVSHKIMRAATRVPKDSGIFVGSDGTSSNSDSSGDGFSVAQLKSPKGARRSNKLMAPFMAAAPVKAAPEPSRRQIQKTESLKSDPVQDLIARAVESNSASLDLSQCGLTSISDEALKPLHQLIREPRFEHAPETEQAFHSLTPSIKLFLASNSLQEVPGELIRLRNIGVLSLRNNCLTQLPANVGDLINLTELNIANNKLRWLPWELLGLLSGGGALEGAQLGQNDYFQPSNCIPAETCVFASNLAQLESVNEQSRQRIEMAKSSGQTELLELYMRVDTIQRELARRMQTQPDLGLNQQAKTRRVYAFKQFPVFVGATFVTFLDKCGVAIKGSPPQPSTLPESNDTILTRTEQEIRSHPCFTQVAGSGAYHTPSLFALATQATVRADPYVDHAISLLPDDAPTTVKYGLSNARQVSRMGGQRCSVCSKSFVTPAAEWIEYWHHLPDSLTCSGQDLVFPFLRRTCSWGCAIGEGVVGSLDV